MITEAQLKQVMPHLSAQKLQLYLPHLNQAMQTYGVDTMLRTAAFVAQLAHESGEFRFMEELWGPTAAQQRYEPPSDLARRLGNTEPGDGKRFKGRGPIQITGRFNYKKYGDLLGVDLLSQPEMAGRPELAFATAGLFWKNNGLNELADRDEFILITKRINGGTNGLADRQMYYARARSVLADSFVPSPVTRGVPGVQRRIEMPARPLTRGHEAIVEDSQQEAKAAPVKKLIAKKAVAKKTPGKPAAKPAAAKKVAAKKVTAKKVTAKKVTAKKAKAGKRPARARSEPMQL